MYRNWSKKTGRRYILGVVALLLVGTVTLNILMLILRHKGADISIAQGIIMSFLISLIPVGSFSGFVVGLSWINELSDRQKTMLVIFCVPITILAIPFGLAMIIPSIISTIKIKNA